MSLVRRVMPILFPVFAVVVLAQPPQSAGTYCESSSDGSAVACGGMRSEENDMEMEGLARGLEALGPMPLVMMFLSLAAVILGGIWSHNRKREAQHETLRLMIEKGHDVDQELIDKLLR